MTPDQIHAAADVLEALGDAHHAATVAGLRHLARYRVLRASDLSPEWTERSGRRVVARLSPLGSLRVDADGRHVLRLSPIVTR